MRCAIPSGNELTLLSYSSPLGRETPIPERVQGKTSLMDRLFFVIAYSSFGSKQSIIGGIGLTAWSGDQLLTVQY